MNISFLHYDSRSGSTFLARRLSDSGSVASPPEVSFVLALSKTFPDGKIAQNEFSRAAELVRSDRKRSDWKLDEGFIAQIERGDFASVCELTEGAVRYCYGNAIGQVKAVLIKKDYTHGFEYLDRSFPTAKHVFLHRDGRAVYLSKRKNIYSLTQRPFVRGAVQGAFEWVKFCRQVEKAKAVLRGKRYLELRYEKMVGQQTEEVLKDILSFIDGEGKGSGLGYVVPDRYDQELHANIFNDPLQGAAERWQSEIGYWDRLIFESIAAPTLRRMSYPITVKVNLPFYFNPLFYAQWVRERLVG